MDFVSVELEQLQVPQEQRSEVNLVLGDVEGIFFVAEARLQVAGSSETLEEEQRHKSAVEKVLVRPQVGQRSQMINAAVTVRIPGGSEQSPAVSVFFQLLSSLQEIFHLPFRQNPQGDPGQDRRTRGDHVIDDSTCDIQLDEK